MDWREMWGGVNGRFPSLFTGDAFSQATEPQQGPKRDVIASQVPIPEAARAASGDPAAASSRITAATDGLTPATAGGPRSEDDLSLARRRAFLDSKDSLGGARAVRGVLADEVQARGGGERPDPQKTSVRNLEDRLTELQQQGKAYTDQTMNPSFSEALEAGSQPELAKAIKGVTGDAPGGRVSVPDDAYRRPVVQEPFGGIAPPQAAPASNAPAGPGGMAQAAINAWMQTGLRDSLQREPLNQPASWQINPTPLPGPKVDAWRESGLAAAAAAGVQLPGSEGEAVARAFATGPMGSRNGMYKPGNTMPLGFREALELPPLNSRLIVSGPATRR